MLPEFSHPIHDGLGMAACYALTNLCELKDAGRNRMDLGTAGALVIQALVIETCSQRISDAQFMPISAVVADKSLMRLPFARIV